MMCQRREKGKNWEGRVSEGRGCPRLLLTSPPAKKPKEFMHHLEKKGGGRGPSSVL